MEMGQRKVMEMRVLENSGEKVAYAPMSVEEDKMIRIVLSSGGTYMSPVTSLKERTLEALSGHT